MIEENKIAKSFFHEGAIALEDITQCLQKYAADGQAGAYSTFMGQVRADRKGDQEVSYMEYTAYREMAVEKWEEIKQELAQKYAIRSVEMIHSLGKVPLGGCCLFVLTVSAHRKAAMEACAELVERIKKELPIWGKEYFGSLDYQWKTNR